MNKRLIQLATLIRPELKDQKGFQQAVGAIYPLQLLFFTPLLVVGLIALVFQTDLTVYTQNAPVILLLSVVLVLLKWFRFMLITEFQDGMYSIQDNTLDIIALWSGILVFGPSIIWLDIITTLIERGINMPGAVFTKAERWQFAAEVILQGTTGTLVGTLGGLWIYGALGGALPLNEATIAGLTPAIAASFFSVAVTFLTVVIVVPMYTSVIRSYIDSDTGSWTLKITLRSLSVQLFGTLVAIPIALVYSTVGVAFYFVFLFTLAASSYIAHRLSNALERNRQRTREMEQLERLARALIGGKPGHEGIRQALKEYIPGMFSFGMVEIRLFPEDTLAVHPPSARPFEAEGWKRLATRRNELLLQEGDQLPWGKEPIHYALLYIPIMDDEADIPIGGVLIRRTLLNEQIKESVAAARSLTAQIASALRREVDYRKTIEFERSNRELELAGRIQQRFLSPRLQEDEDIGIPGCQLAMYLEPARNMSGDFFDALQLENGHWAFIVADVADKGVAASLYMALSITLLRTYTHQYGKHHPMRPDMVISEVNERLIEYARTDQFVTLAFVYLDPQTGACTYTNAGHNPPVILRTGGTHDELVRTGIPLGIMEDWEFTYGTFDLNPGETLVMYTDGVTEAQNLDRDLYDDDGRLHTLLEAHHETEAKDLLNAIVNDVEAFTEGAPSADDLTLMILKRMKQ